MYNNVDDGDTSDVDEVMRPFLRYTTTAASTLSSCAAADMTSTYSHDSVQRTTTTTTTTKRVASTLPALRANAAAATSSVALQQPRAAAAAVDDDDDAADMVTSSSLERRVQWQQLLPRLTGGRADAARVLQLIFPPRVMHASPPQPLLSSSQPAHAQQAAAACGHVGGGRVWHVSTLPCSRDDVAALHAQLQQRLQARRARADGLCAIRRAVYDDVFAELVRQVTIEEAARGVLLQRIRDELRQQQLRVHAALLRRARAAAVRAVMDSPSELPTLRERVAALSSDKATLLTRRHALEERLRQLERRITEERVRRSKECQDELTYLRRANQQLSMRLKAETERASVLTTTTTTTANALHATPAAASNVDGVM